MVVSSSRPSSGFAAPMLSMRASDALADRQSRPLRRRPGLAGAPADPE